jgi:hypothetical protein
MTAVHRAAVAAANVGATAVLMAVVAFWGWRWFVPQPPALTPKAVDDVAAALAVAPPFGAAPAAGPVAAAPLAGDPRLLGVFAEPDGRGRALFRMPDGSARLATAGEDMGGAGTLVAVQPDGVTLRDTRGERTIALRAQAAPSRAPATPPGPTAAAASCVPAGYKGPVVRLNAELVTGLIQQPQALAAVAEPGEGALVVRDEGGFAAMLGLRKGDRVIEANGIALRSPDDVIVAVLRPLAANQPVRLAGMRGAQPHDLLIVNAGACR